MLGYAFRRIVRSWPLFVAIIAGVLVSSTMFATINIGSNEIARQVVDKAIEDVPVDYLVKFWSPTDLDTITELSEDISTIQHVKHTEIMSRLWDWEWIGGKSIITSYVGIENDSYAYQSLTPISGETTLGANQTLIEVSSANATQYSLHDIVNLTITYSTEAGPSNFTLSLEVVGFVKADDRTITLLTGQDWRYRLDKLNLFIVDWEATFRPLIQFFIDRDYYSPFEDEIDVFIDREAVISSVDIEGTLNRLAVIEWQLSNMLMPYGAHIEPRLKWALQVVSYLNQILLFVFMAASAPIFFIALYMGITLSDVSFNLRRREIGLLLTKGFSRNRLLRMFMLEGLLVGVIAGAAGILLAILIVPFFTGVAGNWQPVSSHSMSWTTLLLCMIFSLFVGGLSVFFAARRAIRIPTVEALREYRYTPTPTGYRKLLAQTALVLGSYKMIIWIAGINVPQIVFQIPYPGFLIMILLGIWLTMDALLSPFAVLLFLYGFTMIAVHGSTLIYKASEKIISWTLGDVGVLATRSIQRNPARTAAVVFILALVIGYGVQTVAVLASDHDYTIRSVYTDVGSDIGAKVTPTSNASSVVERALNITGVQAATAEYWLNMETPSWIFMRLCAVNPQEWMQTAYYEPGWFSYVPAEQALAALAEDNHTIILHQRLVRTLHIPLGSNITVTFGSNATQLKVVGFYGTEPTGWLYTDRRVMSLIPVGLLEEFGVLGSSEAKLLVKVAPGADPAAISEALEDFTEIAEATSAMEMLMEYATNPLLNAQGNIMRMGVAFAFVLASVGTLVVVTFTLKEKRRETALMAARGLTFKQTAALLIAESTTWVLFAALIGLLTGFIASYGAFQSLNNMDPLLPRNLAIIVSLPVLLPASGMVALLLVCAVAPMLLAARRAQTAVDVLR